MDFAGFTVRSGMDEPSRVRERYASLMSRVLTVAALALAALVTACDAAPPSASAGETGPPASHGTSAAPSASLDPLRAAASGAWRPAPFPFSGSADFLDRAELACRAATEVLGEAPVLVRDVRGDAFLVLVFGDAAGAAGSAAWACFAPTSATTAGDVVVLPLDTPAQPVGDQNLDLVLYKRLEADAGDVRTVALGRVGRDGVRVVASFDDESEVDATKSGGWWAMWWPTDVDAATVAAVDRQSIAIDALPIPRR